MDQPRKPAHVGLVQRRIHLVQHAERTRLELKDPHQQAHRCQRLFSTAQQKHVLHLLARRRRNQVNAAFRGVRFIGQIHRCLPAAEQLHKRVGKVLIDLGKRLVELRIADVGDLLDRPHGVRNGVQQVLALCLQKLMPLRRFGKLFQRHHVHRPHRLQLALQRARLTLRGAQRFGLCNAHHRCIRTQHTGLHIQVLQGLCFQVLQVAG